MPTITITLELTGVESRLLDLFLAAENSGETREQAASRLAFYWLRTQLKAIEQQYEKRNRNMVSQAYFDPAIPPERRVAALDALGFTYDGLAVTRKPDPPVEEPPVAVEEPPVEPPVEEPVTDEPIRRR